MKKSNIYLLIAAFAVIATVLYFSLREPKEAVAGEANEPVKETHGHEALKEVELNEAQYTASGIELGTFTMKNLSDVVNANGYTELPPQNQADVSVHLSGVVQFINVIEGQFVKKGQVLATIESPEFAKLQEAYLTSKSNLEYLTLEYERQKTLSEENVNSKKVYQRTKSDFEIEKAKFNSLQKQLVLLNLSKAPATSSMPILAPISGYITQVNIKIGSNAEVGKPLFSIIDNSKLHVDLLVYEKDLQKVKPGQNISFTLTNQDNVEIKGKVFTVSKAFENETKSVAVHADIANTNQALIPGMYVNALIDVGVKRLQALPVDAVIRAEGREFIFILEEGHKEDGEHKGEGRMFHFQRVEIKTGVTQLGFVQVTLLQKIAPNAQIVLKGAYYIQSHLVKSEGGGNED